MRRIFITTLLLFVVACSPSVPSTLMTAIDEPITTNTSLPEPIKTVNTITSPDVISIPVIFDDDGSPDGTTALLYLLSHPFVDLKAVNISYGEAYPEIYIQHLGRMMDDFGIIHIALGYGQKPASTDNIHFPEIYRLKSNKFWGFPIPNSEKTYQSYPSPELMVSVLQQSPQPVTVFVTGPCTNLAEALRIDPEIKKNIAAVYIMGGAVYVPGNIQDFYPSPFYENTVAEWNFIADPQAAKEVFDAGLDIFLVPLDATNQVLVTNQDTNLWRQGGEIADFAADIYDWLLNEVGTGEALIWDLMTAVIMLEPGLCDFTPLQLEVITDKGNTLGQSAIRLEGEPNVSVCLEPNSEMIKQKIIDVLSIGR